MQFNEWISLVSIILALFAFIYTLISNTKKYELTYQYFSDILSWYKETIKTLSLLRHSLNCDEKNNTQSKADDIFNVQLAELSSLIETGRFYFPNIKKDDSFGENKPAAYQGYRNVILDFLVFSYQIFNKDDCNRYIDHLEMLQRLFTSHIFQHLEPVKLAKTVRKNTNISTTKNMTIDEFLMNEPEIIATLYPIDNNRSHWEKGPLRR